MIFKLIKVFIVHFKKVRKDEKLRKQFNYYTDLNEISLYNWWKCKEGDYSYLWKERNEYIPYFFETVFADMLYQMEYLDLSDLRKASEVNYYMNLYLSTNDIKYKRKSDTKKAEYEQMIKVISQEPNLNALIKTVQKGHNLNFIIDSKTITAGYFFSLLNDLRNGNNTEERHN